jgi:hypothetical protein
MSLDMLEDGDDFQMNCLIPMHNLPRYRAEASELPRVAVLHDAKNARSTHRLISGDEPALFILRITI